MLKDMKLLGLPVRDRVSGFEGIATSVSFDLYGCVQAVVSPRCKAGVPDKTEESRWFDTKRLETLDTTPVMPVPTFEHVPGGSEKSLPRMSPLG